MLEYDFRKSVRALKKHARFKKLVEKHGAPKLERYHGKIGVFPALLRAIIFQQLSGKAASAIHLRVLALFPKNEPVPEKLLKIPVEKLRAAGLSVQKIIYVKDLAKRSLDGTIDESRFSQMTSDEIIEHVTQVKGIGIWTAQMLLIFTLKRPDILPVGDLGVQKGFQIVYGMKKLPAPKYMQKLALPWQEHATAASWYLWRAVDDFNEARKRAKD